ncbi:MAG: Uma2 family endonuclease [Candidatus Bipolaricaulia bacterium]
MAKTHPHIKYTVEDYLNVAESETERYELLEGELVMVPAPNWFHQSIAAALFKHLDDYVESHDLGVVRFAPLDVELSNHDVAQPDLIFLSHDNLDLVQEGRVRGAPDLVVEIFSPSTEQRDRTTKRTLYARHGVGEYWLVDPEAETIEVLSLGEEGFTQTRLFEREDTLYSLLLSSLEIPVDQVFVEA